MFLGIACRDKVSTLKNVIEKHNIPWLNLMDTKEISFKYGVTGYPEKILLDPTGKIIYKFSGEAPQFFEEIKKYIK